MRQDRTTGEADRAQVARTDDGVRPDAHGWLPLASAPDWSGSVLVYGRDVYGPIYAVAQKDAEDCWIYGPEIPDRTFTPLNWSSVQFTHWQPLPKSPEGSE